MVLICPYCDIEISEKLVEAEDGCCPECGTLITARSVADQHAEENEDDDNNDIYEEDEFAGEFDDDDIFKDEDYEDTIDFGDLGDTSDLPADDPELEAAMAKEAEEMGEFDDDVKPGRKKKDEIREMPAKAPKGRPRKNKTAK